MDRGGAIKAFLAECYQPKYHTSFACFAEPAAAGAGTLQFETHCARESVLSPHAAGMVRAHVFSVTKSMIGLFWAQMVHNIDGKHPYLYRWLGHPELGAMRIFLDMRNPVRDVQNVTARPLHRYLTMTSGVATGQTDALYVAQVRTLHHGAFSGTIPLNTFGSVVYDRYFDRAPPEGQWRYSDACMQIAAEAAEEFERAMTGNDGLTARDVILSHYFPPHLHDRLRQSWPMLYAGYDAEDAAGVLHPVYNTVGFYGLQMSGLELRDLGVFLLTHHLPLLQRIYSELPGGGAAGQGYAVTLEEKDEADRHGWRYWAFWWMPVCGGGESGDCARGQWIAAIGHMGQYLLLELTRRRVFVRQHFVVDPLFENIDIACIEQKQARRVRMPEFVAAAQRLHAILEMSAAAPQTQTQTRAQAEQLGVPGIGRSLRRAREGVKDK